MAIAHITLPTSDVENSRDFYHNTLGWQPIEKPANISTDATWLQIAPGQQLHLVRVDNFNATEFDREYGRHIAITYPGEEFDELRERLAAHGAEVIPPARETPFERFFFKDPTGICFEVVDSSATPEFGT